MELLEPRVLLDGDLDFGDAPDDALTYFYPTLAAHDGARHGLTGPWLGGPGDMPDHEADGQPDLHAAGDDDGGIDDEDGVDIPAMLVQGTTASISFAVGGGGGTVTAWIDWDGSGQWEDPAERIVAAAFANGPHTINVSVPRGPGVVTGRTYARFRISDVGGVLQPHGLAADGEVEDHDLIIVEPLPPNTKWMQGPDQTPNGVAVALAEPDAMVRRMGDDFECDELSLLTDVHLWGSWKDDAVGQIEQIHLQVYDDDPTGTPGLREDNAYAMPGEPLWEGTFGPDSFEVALAAEVELGEAWWDPATAELLAGADTEIWQVSVEIDRAEAFFQEGTPASPRAYWLVADLQVEGGEFGWKTRARPQHSLADAVWADEGETWEELRYPLGHPSEGESIDLAFALTFAEGEDFGDAPDGYGTLRASDGPYHTCRADFWLGDGVDAEPDGLPDPDAAGDDSDLSDDEDGVHFPWPLLPGHDATVLVTASADGFLDAWVDVGANGMWDLPADQVFEDVPLLAGLNVLTFPVPETAPVGRTTFSRFRFSETGGLDPTGPGGFGEVEDHAVDIYCPIEDELVLDGEHSVPFTDFDVIVEGTIQARVDWTGTSEELTVSLMGWDDEREGDDSDEDPERDVDQMTLCAEVTGTSPLELSHEVLEDDIKESTTWRLIVRNAAGDPYAEVDVLVAVPCDEQLRPTYEDQRIELRSGNLWPRDLTTLRFLDRLEDSEGSKLHGFISESTSSGCVDLWWVERLGVGRQFSVASGDVFGYLAKETDTDDSRIASVVQQMTWVPAALRVDPHILVGDYQRYQLGDPAAGGGNYVLRPDGSVVLLVGFAEDAAGERIQQILAPLTAEQHAFSERLWQVRMDPVSILDLAGNDEVLWIEAGPLPYLPENDTARALVGVDEVQDWDDQTFVYGGFTGVNITVGIDDAGYKADGITPWGGIESSHNDLDVVLDNTFSHFHATHIAGTVAGSGVQSDKDDDDGSPNDGTPYQWRGMAPHARLIDTDDLVSAGLLSTAIRLYSLDVVNYSQWISLDGNHTWEEYHIDQAIRGGTVEDGETIPRRPWVVSAGNAAEYGVRDSDTGKQLGFQTGYFSLTKQLKNGIVVGNWDASDPTNEHLSASSSMGPTHDGRIKPDLVAPGTNVISTAPQHSEFQIIEFSMPSGPPTAGEFTLTFDGRTTDPIPYNAGPGKVSDALAALTPPVSVEATGGPLPEKPIQVEFIYSYAFTNVPGMTSSDIGIDNNASSNVWTFEDGGDYNSYMLMSGTSVATPVVTGTVALMLQAWNETYYPDETDVDEIPPPLPSTLRAVLIQTADDIVDSNVRRTECADVDNGQGYAAATPGPDFATGWGMLNAAAAVELLLDHRMVEGRPEPNQIEVGAVNQGQVKEYEFVVTDEVLPDSGELRVTLAWDDLEVNPLSELYSDLELLPHETRQLLKPAHSDLDLELVDPNGVVHYPWQLGQIIMDADGHILEKDEQPPGTEIQVRIPITPTDDPESVPDDVPASALTGNGAWYALPGKDHLNNVEQVVVEDPVTGHWKARVIGFDIPRAHLDQQDFSLVGMPYPDLAELEVYTTHPAPMSGFGVPMNFTWHLENSGALSTGETGETFDYRIWLSKDFYLDETGPDADIELTDDNAPEMSLGPLAAGAAIDPDPTSCVTIEQEQADSLYGWPEDEDMSFEEFREKDPFILIEVDSGDDVLEHNEFNVAVAHLARPADVILVLDRSGSMVGHVPVSGHATTKMVPKMVLLRESVRLFLDLMRVDEDDQLAIMSFNDSSTIDFGMVELTTDNFDDAWGVPGSLDPDGETNIYDTLFDAFAEMASGAVEDHRHVLVFFSDGMQTTSFDPMAFTLALVGFIGLDTHMFSVGFGTEGGGDHTGIDIDVLQQLTNAGETGFFHVTDQASGLDKFFVEALGGAMELQVLEDPTGELASGQSDTVGIQVTEQEASVRFVLTWDDPDLGLDLAVRTPSGLEIGEDNHTTFGSRVSMVEGESYEIITVYLPVAVGAAEDWQGTWEMVISNPASTAAVEYTASALAYSTIRAGLEAPDPAASGGTGSSYEPGQEISLVGWARQRGGEPACAVAATVTPNVPLVGLSDLLASAGITAAELAAIPTTINGETISDRERMYLALLARVGGGDLLPRADLDPFELTSGECGEVSGTFLGTETEGAYELLVQFEGLAEDCQEFRREDKHSAAVVPTAAAGRTDVNPTRQGQGEVGVTVTPQDTAGGFIGPGRTDITIDVDEGKWTPTGEVIDNLDGTYSRGFSVTESGPATVRVQIGEVQLPAEVVDTALPVPIGRQPAGWKNDGEATVSVYFSAGTDPESLTTPTLVSGEVNYRPASYAVFSEPGAVRMEFTVPAGLAAGAYDVHLGDPASLTPAVEGVSFLVAGAGQEFPEAVEALGGAVDDLLSAATRAEGLAAAGDVLHALREVPTGNVLDGEGPAPDVSIRQAAIEELLGLLAAGTGEARSRDIPAVLRALNAARIDARYIPAPPADTPTGAPVEVHLGNGVRVVFGDVLSSGQTTAEFLQGPSHITGPHRGTPHVTCRIATTATYSEPAGVEVTIQYDEADFADESLLRILHQEGGQWVDVTAGLDTAADRIRAQVEALGDFTVICELPLDFGDAPNTYGTVRADNGAYHTIGEGLFLGAAVDAEGNGQAHPGALGDDQDAEGDDEDGVTFRTPLVPGRWAVVEVEASAAGRLDAWIDFNGDGQWAVEGDRIFANEPVEPGLNVLVFPVPATATPEVETFARFRLSQDGRLRPRGCGGYGEVEDHPVTIAPTSVPAVEEVMVRGRDWSPEFLTWLEVAGLGDAVHGYRVPVGSAGQLVPLPWVNVDQISIRLSEEVHLGPRSLALLGGGDYVPESFRYSAQTGVATWTLSEPLQAESVSLRLAGNVASPSGIPIDGEWTDAFSTYPSGDGTPGGEFTFRLNLLPGDVDLSGEVRSSDTIKVRRKSNTVPGDPAYSCYYDVDGSGDIRSSDTIKVRRLSNTELPAGEPVIPPSAPLGQADEPMLTAAATGDGVVAPLPSAGGLAFKDAKAERAERAAALPIDEPKLRTAPARRLTELRPLRRRIAGSAVADIDAVQAAWPDLNIDVLRAIRPLELGPLIR